MRAGFSLLLESFISREEAADFLGVSTRTLDRYVRKRILKSHRRGRRTMFLRLDIESLTEVPTPKSHIIPNDQGVLPQKQDTGVAALVNLAQEMHRQLQKKDGEIAQLNFQLGRFQEIAKNSIPLLEAKEKEQSSVWVIKNLKRDIHVARFGRLLFFALFAISLGVIGILWNFLLVI